MTNERADASRSALGQRADALFHESRREMFIRTDRMFAALMVFQWVGAVVAALVLSPRTWDGSTSHIHPHVIAAVFLGGALSSLPVFLAITRPGFLGTRFTIAIAQVLWSALLI